MKTFNKIFKQIILENELSVDEQDRLFPKAFSFPDYGLEFIFDIMPTFGQQYIWHTVTDLQNIPELVETLKNTDKNILSQIAYGFQEAAAAEEQQYPEQELKTPTNFREISAWLKQLKNENNDMLTETQDLNLHDPRCFNTVPNVVKEVKPRKYRRGLKALSIDNRRKFNQLHNIPQDDVSPTDRLNKVKEQTNIQQPISKSVIVPAPGVKRPLGLNRSQKKIKRNFSTMVYQPSITQITKQNAKKRCLLARQNKQICAEETEDLEFSTNYNQKPQPIIKTQPEINVQPKLKKQLCVICKTYVQPKQVELDNGQKVTECPKCGLRLQNSNY